MIAILVWLFVFDGAGGSTPDAPDVEINVENPLPYAE